MTIHDTRLVEVCYGKFVGKYTMPYMIHTLVDFSNGKFVGKYTIHDPQLVGKFVGKYTSPVDCMGFGVLLAV